jgi:hypothetical protein
MSLCTNLNREFAVAEHKGRIVCTPRLQCDLGILNQQVKGIDILLHETKHVDMLPDDLMRRFGPD